MLSVRASAPDGDDERLFDVDAVEARLVRGMDGEHLAIVCGEGSVRLDVADGTVASGPVALRFYVANDWRLDDQVAAIRAFRSPPQTVPRYDLLARKLLALQALDMRNEGASLRLSADILLGPGDWPGDGEHRKSTVRRLIATGERMVRAGAQQILRPR